MKPYLCILFLLIVLSNLAYAQENLLYNGSFEQYVDCPNSPSEFSGNCVGWVNARTDCEYYNACAVPSSGASIPDNWLAHQYAYNGNAYIGLYSFLNGDARDYAQGTLVTPLSIGVNYYVSFETSLADSSPNASNKIGALFTDVQYGGLNSASIINYAHVYTDSIITNSTNWITVSGCFIADSAYRYIMLGNFFDNSQTNSQTITLPNVNNAYYLIDDVQVFADSNCDGIPDASSNFIMPTAFTPNGDNINDIYSPVPTSINIEVFRIYNRWGQKVYEASGVNIGWDGKYEGESQPIDGYTYYIETKSANGNTEKRTGSFTLLR